METGSSVLEWGSKAVKEATVKSSGKLLAGRIKIVEMKLLNKTTYISLVSQLLG